MRRSIRLVPASLIAAIVVMSGTARSDDRIEAGEKIFKKCKACHSVEEGKHKLGPSLFGIVGREAALVETFKYSKALREAGIIWSVEELDAFIAAPKTRVKGTKMAFAGIKKQDQRDSLIVYLETLK